MQATGPQRALLGLLRAPEREGLLHGALLRLTRGLTLPVQPGHPRAPDGTPLFRQGDPAGAASGSASPERGPTLAHAGCAVTACAMALSRIGDTVVTPDALVRHLRASGRLPGAARRLERCGRGPPRAPSGPAPERSTAPSSTASWTRDARSCSGWCTTSRASRGSTGSASPPATPGPGQYTANDPATGRTTLLLRTDWGAEQRRGRADPLRLRRPDGALQHRSVSAGLRPRRRGRGVTSHPGGHGWS